MGPLCLDADITLEYNETQCDKRNTYRRKVKEEKAAAAVVEEGETPTDHQTDGGANGTTNGHAEVDDEDRPVKKLKAENGTAVPPDPDGMDYDEPNGEQEGGHDEDDDDDHQDDDVEDDEDEAEEDGTNETPGVTLMDDQEDDELVTMNDMRDEALDDPDDDSD